MSRIEGVKFEGFRKIRYRSDLNGIQTLKPFPIISFFLFMCHEHYLVLVIWLRQKRLDGTP